MFAFGSLVGSEILAKRANSLDYPFAMTSEHIYTYGGSPCHPEVADQCQIVQRGPRGGIKGNKIVALRPKRAAAASDFFLRHTSENNKPQTRGECFDRWAETYEILLRSKRQYDQITALEEIEELEGKQKRVAVGEGVPFVSFLSLAKEEQTELREEQIRKLYALAKKQEWKTPSEAEAAKEKKRRSGEEWRGLLL